MRAAGPTCHRLLDEIEAWLIRVWRLQSCSITPFPGLIAILLTFKVDHKFVSIFEGSLYKTLSSLEGKLGNLEKCSIVKAVTPIILLFLDLSFIFDHLEDV